MTVRPLLPPVVTKELRALFPAWTACVLAIVAGGVIGGSFRAVMLAYGAGAIILGAQSIGHEYTHRTLAVLLSQPSDRRRLLLAKIGVLTPMLLIVGAVAWAVLLNDHELHRSDWNRNLVVLLPLLCAFCLAPWLTMVCRSQLAGVVFAVAIPASMNLVTHIFGALRYGLRSSEADRFALALWWYGFLALCAAAAVLTWTTFARLEAIEGGSPEVRLPTWFRAGKAAAESHDMILRRAPRPFWRLVNKELHLQHMTFVVGALYLAAWVAVTLLRSFVQDFPVIPLGAITLMYLVLLSILIGSLASAEERQLGTLEWQLLMPVPNWQQWTVKAGVTLGLALAFGVGLPAVLNYLGGSGDLRTPMPMWRQTVVVIVLLTTWSLYASSLSTSGVSAMALSFPSILGAVALIQTVGTAVGWILSYFLIGTGRATPRPFDAGQATSFAALLNIVVMAMAAGLVALLLWLAFVNHRSAERSTARVWRQIVWIAAFLTFAVIAIGVFIVVSAVFTA